MEPRLFYIIMLDNETLRKKLSKELNKLKLDGAQEDVMVKELNYLSDLLVDVYVIKTKQKLR